MAEGSRPGIALGGLGQRVLGRWLGGILTDGIERERDGESQGEKLTCAAGGRPGLNQKQRASEKETICVLGKRERKGD